MRIPLLVLGAAAGLAGPLVAQTVVLSEFQARNDTVLEDWEEDRPDWIEIHNAGPGPVDLAGWFLTDDPGDLQKWSFGATTLLPEAQFLVVFASGKDLLDPDGIWHTNFKLNGDGEYLALVRPDGLTVAHEWSPAFPPQYDDVSYGLSWPLGPASAGTYFSVPTPGGPNGPLGFAIVDSGSSPALPDINDTITVTATVVGETSLLTGVRLFYRVMYGGETPLNLRDDGAGGDLVAGDQVWTGIIPAGVAAAGEMLRWRLEAQGQGGLTARYPLFLFPEDSPEYFGTMMPDPSVVTPLPVLYWFVENPALATSGSGTRCSLWYLDRFYDNVFVRRRGGSSAFWPKQNFKFDFNRGDHFVFDSGLPPVEEFNLNSTWSDKAYVRAVLAWETYRDAGGDHCISFHTRVQQNAAFYSVAMFVEQPDEDYLTRNGLHPRGALYKMFNSGTDAYAGVEKKTRLDEDNTDLEEFLNGVNQPAGAARTAFLFDNLDVPACINYLAATAVMHDNDHVAKNYYLYRDSEGDLEWRFLPWDKDLTFGRNMDGQLVLNDTIWADDDPMSHPLFGDQAHPKVDGPWNTIIDAIYSTPELQELYLRRLRTVMDELLQAPTTEAEALRYEARIAELEQELAADVALDQTLWGIPNWGTQSLDFAAALDQLRNDYLTVRRVHLYQTHSVMPGGIIPDAQEGVPSIGFGAMETDPPSGNPAEEYLELVNPGTEAVDLSGWSLGGSVVFDFPAGSVIPAGGSAYLSPDLRAFRARATGPSGGQSLLVLGPYAGDLAAGVLLELRDADGNLVNTNNGPVLTVRDLRAGATATARVCGSTPGADQVVALSLTGAGPTPTPFGSVSLSPPIELLGRRAADAAGVTEIEAHVPAFAAGRPVWLQALDLGSGALTPPLALVVAP